MCSKGSRSRISASTVSPPTPESKTPMGRGSLTSMHYSRSLMITRQPSAVRALCPIQNRRCVLHPPQSVTRLAVKRTVGRDLLKFVVTHDVRLRATHRSLEEV